MATGTATRFRNRAEGGRRLAERMREYAGREDVVVLGLPRGGVVVAFEVAAVLGAPLDVFLVRKLGVPGHEELALGAIATGGMRVLNKQLIESLDIPPEWIEAIDAKERRELERRDLPYRAARAPTRSRGQGGDAAGARPCRASGRPGARGRGRAGRRSRSVRAAANAGR